MSIEKNTPNSLKHEFSYTVLINETICLIKDAAALGIYTYLASKPEGWNINKQELMNHFNVGREFINSRFKYLKENGFLTISPTRDAAGKIISWETTLRRIQNTENPPSGEPSRIRVNQNLAKPESGKSAPINKRDIEIKENINIGDSSSPTTKKDYEKDQRFMSFYSIYPKKEKPRDAWKAFKSVIGKDDALLAKIITDVKKRHTEHDKWKDDRFIPYPASYLRSADYESEIYNYNNQESTKKAEQKKKADEIYAQRIKAQEELAKTRDLLKPNQEVRKGNPGKISDMIKQYAQQQRNQ